MNASVVHVDIMSFAASAAGYRYGKSLIPITSEDEEALKIHAAKCLSLLGFTKCENLSWQCIIMLEINMMGVSVHVATIKTKCVLCAGGRGGMSLFLISCVYNLW